jgi:hypothetical protein
VSRPSRFALDPRARAIDLYRSSEGRTITDIALEQGSDRHPDVPSGSAKMSRTGMSRMTD